MTELSKTAAAARKAVQRSQKRETKELTIEERLRNIRNNVAAGLYVPVTEVDLLLEQYDALKEKRKGQLETDQNESNAHKAMEELETLPPNS